MLKLSRKSISFALVIGLLLVAITPLTVFGADDDNLTFGIGCNGFTVNGGSIKLDRDNTGAGREQFSVGAIDGRGQVIFNPVIDSALVGTQIAFQGEGTYTWSNTPAANPITLSVVSLEGNTAPQQIIYSTVGNCEGLPTGTVSGVVVPNVPNIAFGELTSPAIELGDSVPVPKSDTEEIESLLGYAIVNTSYLNLRTGDGPQYKKVAVVTGGTRAKVIGRNAKFSWWLIEVGNIRGWANAEFLIIRGDVTDAEVLVSGGELQEITFVTFLSQPIYIEKGNLNRHYICNIVPNEYFLNARSAQVTDPNFYLIEGVCEDGRTARGWIASDLGVIRNPAGLILPVIQ